MEVDSEDTGVLVRSAADGDQAAWKALVTRYGWLVWSAARGYGLGRADAEEVFQTTWLRLTEHLTRLKEPERVGAWLATTARREAARVVRARARVTVTDDSGLLDRGTDSDSPERLVLESEEATAELTRARQVWSAFQQLSDRCRELLRLLTAVPRISYLEIAATLQVPVGSIGPTRARCLARLRALLAPS
jgi:RNA polymerase sigma factor (sigma-70 family)